MKKLIWSILFSGFFLTPLAFAQSSDGVLVSPPIQDQGSNQDNSGNNNKGNNASDSGILINSDNSGITQNQQPNKNTQNQQPNKNTQSNKKAYQPQQIAINACEGKSAADTCQIMTHYGLVQGTCINTPDNKYFYCKRTFKRYKPNQQGQQQGQQQEPQEQQPEGQE